MSRDTAQKLDALVSGLRSLRSVAVAFSGGVDSAFLAVTALDVLGPDRMTAMLGVSESLSAELGERAHHIASMYGVPLLEVNTRELERGDYVANRGDRCFHCKQELWSVLVPIAAAHGFACVADGTITDDVHEHRPGARAGARAGIISPLAHAGFSKADVRAAARDRGLPVWDAPAAPCLASRLATGVHVTRERLERVDRAERALRAFGIAGDLRVRDLGAEARIEIAPDELAFWNTSARRDALVGAVISAGFDAAHIDQRGYRRGALQERDPAGIAIDE
jgi:uncharacterized protein